MRIIFIQCYGDSQPNDAEPLSVEVLAGAVRKSFRDEVDVSIVCLREYESETVDERILQITKQKAEIIAISIPQGTLSISLRLLDSLFSSKQHQTIVIGNSLPTYEPDMFLSRFPDVIIVNGWGEDSFCEIVKRIIENQSLDDIDNLTLSRNGKVLQNSIRWPQEIGLPFKVGGEIFTPRIEASRGCAYNNCNFCLRPKNNGRTLLKLSQISNIFMQIDDIKKEGKRFFTFTDEDFLSANFERCEEISQYLLNVGDLSFSFSCRANTIYSCSDSQHSNVQKRNKLIQLKHAGLKHIFIGAESFSQTQLNRFGKGILVQDIVSACRILQDEGISYELGFIIFDPFVNLSEIKQNLIVISNNYLWKNIGQIFNHLRIYKNSFLFASAHQAMLLRHYQMDTLEYQYDFYSKEVGWIFRRCLEWKQMIDKVYVYCRNQFRLGDSENCSNWILDFILEYRRIEFSLLNFLVNNAENIQMQELQRYCLAQEELVANILSSMNPQTTSQLKNLISEYFSRRHSFSNN